MAHQKRFLLVPGMEAESLNSDGPSCLAPGKDLFTVLYHVDSMGQTQAI